MSAGPTSRPHTTATATKRMPPRYQGHVRRRVGRGTARVRGTATDSSAASPHLLRLQRLEGAGDGPHVVDDARPPPRRDRVVDAHDRARLDGGDPAPAGPRRAGRPAPAPAARAGGDEPVRDPG